MDQNSPDWALEKIVPQWQHEAIPVRLSLRDGGAITAFDPAGSVHEQPHEAISRPGLPRLRRWRRLIGAAALLAAGALGVGGYRWWEANQFLVSTDDAYFGSDSVTVSPQVAGTIAELDVTDNQPVRAGQAYGADRRPTVPGAVAKASADVGLRRRPNSAMLAPRSPSRWQISVQPRRGRGGPGDGLVREADATRYAQLSRTGFGTVQTAQRTAAGLNESKAKLVGDQARLTAAERQIGVLAAAAGDGRGGTQGRRSRAADERNSTSPTR